MLRHNKVKRPLKEGGVVIGHAFSGRQSPVATRGTLSALIQAQGPRLPDFGKGNAQILYPEAES